MLFRQDTSKGKEIERLSKQKSDCPKWWHLHFKDIFLVFMFNQFLKLRFHILAKALHAIFQQYNEILLGIFLI